MAASSAVSNNNPASALYASLNGTQTSTSSSATEDAQTRFLTLLTTQLKNQDPLNPMDNAQMTSQLAQISTVDGITKLNTTLQTLLGNSTDTQALQAASLVGHTVLVAGGTMLLKNGVGAAGLELGGAADDVKATVKDANGLVVRTIDLGALPAGVHAFSWDGKTDNGSAAADGSYSVSFSATQGQNKVTATALEFGTVSSVLRSGQGVSLDLGTLGSIGMSDVKQIL